MAVKLKFSTKFDHMKSRADAAKSLDGKKVNVGVFDGEQAWLAGIHEYGLKIEVTDKMRAFLHGQGLHLKKSTTHITIPERAFLRNGFDEVHAEVVDKAGKALPLVFNGKMSGGQFLTMVGQTLSTAIKVHAKRGSFADNHPFTADRKGTSRPLVSTGQMLDHIDWQVE